MRRNPAFRPPGIMDKFVVYGAPLLGIAFIAGDAVYSVAKGQWAHLLLCLGFSFGLLAVMLAAKHQLDKAEDWSKRPFFVGPYSRELGELYRGSGWYFWDHGTLQGPYNTKGQAQRVKSL